MSTVRYIFTQRANKCVVSQGNCQNSKWHSLFNWRTRMFPNYGMKIRENIFTRSLKLLSSLKLVTNRFRNTITRVLLDNEKNNWKLHAWDSHRSISSFFKPSHKSQDISCLSMFLFHHLKTVTSVWMVGEITPTSGWQFDMKIKCYMLSTFNSSDLLSQHFLNHNYVISTKYVDSNPIIFK